MPAARSAALVAAAVVLAGCGAAEPAPGAPAAITLSPGAHVCVDRPAPDDPLSQEAAAQERPALGPAEPAGFVECSSDTEPVPGQGEWRVRRERRADAGGAALAAALRLPDLPSHGGACTGEGQIVPELYALDDAGHAALVRWPVDGCGHLRKEVVAAHDAVRWAPVAERRLRQITPQGALDSGCEAGWKDMVVVEGAHAAARHGKGTLDAVAKARTVRACTYRVTEDGQAPAGSFEAGRTLDAATWQVVLQVLEAAPAAADGCTAVGQRFATLSTADTQTLYVELDGCRRVLTPDGGLRTATPRLIQELTGP